MRVFLAHFLFVLAAWTLFLKFVFPVAFALAEGAAPGAHVMWDFWWAAHIWLGWALLRETRYAAALAACVAAAEVAIVSVKFALFLSAPEWTMWTAGWFVNKVFVLACFALMLAWLAARSAGRRAAPETGGLPSPGPPR